VTRRFLTLAVVFVVLGGFASPATAQPNVILIVTDDQRRDSLEYMPIVQAELVAKGVTFDHAMVVNPLCCPSRATILTGTYSHTTGVWTNAPPGGGFAALDDSSTLPVWLHAKGYETALIGKYLNGYDAHNTTPAYIPPGWDRWFAFWGTEDYFNYQASDQGSLVSFGGDEASYSTDVLAAQAETFIRSARSPFFLYFTPKAPHFSGGGETADPFRIEPAPRHVGALAGLESWSSSSVNEQDISDKPAWVRGLPLIRQGDIDRLREGQLESLLAVDDGLARMLTALRDIGQLDNTVIIFTSDNGYGWGEHRWAGKRAPYEEEIDVPLVVRIGAGSAPMTRHELVANVDLAPAIAELTGASAPGVEGRSFVPLLNGLTVSWRHRVLVESYDDGRSQPSSYKGGVPSFCLVRGQRWKYVQYGTGEEELYDLGHDASELTNRARDPLLRRLLVKERGRILRSRCRPPGFVPKRRCLIRGGAGPDRIRGTRWYDYVCAGRGRDVIWAHDGRKDVIRCGPGTDKVRADRRDRLFGCERRF